MVVCTYTVTHGHTLKSVGLQRCSYQRRKTGIQAENWILGTAAGCTAFGRPPVNIKEELRTCSLAGFHIEQVQVEHEDDVQLKAPRASETQCARKTTRGPSQTALTNFIVYGALCTSNAGPSFTGYH